MSQKRAVPHFGEWKEIRSGFYTSTEGEYNAIIEYSDQSDRYWWAMFHSRTFGLDAVDAGCRLSLVAAQADANTALIAKHREVSP